jgi:SAM-dependent methyltransferase
MPTLTRMRAHDGGPAARKLLALLDPEPAAADFSAGYLDLAGDHARRPTGVAETLMRTNVIPAVYQRWWRPTLARLFMGPGGPDMPGEYALARQWLEVAPGDTVLDLACGPGNFTRDLAAAAGPAGLVVGVDSSAAMLGRAVSDSGGASPDSAPIAYVRADAGRVPLRERSVDAACCFAALHLMREPFGVLDWMTSLLRPGGRIALMTSCWRVNGLPPALTAAARQAFWRGSGIGLFAPDEITGALAARGYTGIEQRITGAVQFAAGTLPPDAA